MNRQRRKVIARLKKAAKRHFIASQANRDLDCGGDLGDFLRGNDTAGHAAEYARCIARLRRIDPDFPKTQAG